LGKGKLHKFAEIKSFENVFQPGIEELYKNTFYLKGNWSKNYFRNNHPIFLELGCGKGEYTVKLAEQEPNINFIGMDIKGARIWTGARYAIDHNLINVAFIRSRIEFINSFFETNEISEIWLTFPDPQLKRKRNKKRLTGSIFLNMYKQFLVDGGTIHLKTDNGELFEYTRILLMYNHLRLLHETEDLYNSEILGPARDIRTYYEKQFLEKGMKINYLAFSLDHEKEIKEPSVQH
jgi:tRNA (guanine-N7-)-methyltransferase